MELFRLCKEDGYSYPVGRSGERTSEQTWLLQRQLLADSWVVEAFVWLPVRKKIVVPDVTTSTLGDLCVPAGIAERLLPDRRGLELLPILIGEENWFVVNVLGVVEGVHLPSSHFVVLPYPDGDALDLKWINLVHAHPLPYETFRIREHGATLQAFFTTPFRDRYKALGLKGIRFELVGHVIASPELAVPKPTAPAAVNVKARKHRQPKLTTNPLPKSWQAELDLACAALLKRLNLSVDADAKTTLAALDAELRRLRPLWGPNGVAEQGDALLGISAVYGDLLCSTRGWSWVQLSQAKGPRWIGVLSPDGKHVLALVPYMVRQIESDEPTLELQFNMIAGSNLPPATDGQMFLLG